MSNLDALPWSVVVKVGPGWIRYPQPDFPAAIRAAKQYRDDGYRAAVQSCKCGTRCICENDPCIEPFC